MQDLSSKELLILMKKGYIQVYTGDGKGKTTAAFGLALRAAGAGLRVFIGQFLKNCEYSELRSIKKLGDNVVLRQFGRDCFICKEATNEDIAAAREGLEYIRKIINERKFDVVILDEANTALHFNLFDVNELLKILKKRPQHQEIILTGRGAPIELIEIADLVTEMKEVKHYYAKGVQAREGIEK
jgi:cob(I)alamin adenosyltransferase